MADANGILNVIKPLEWTSMEVVRRVRRLTGQKKVATQAPWTRRQRASCPSASVRRRG